MLFFVFLFRSLINDYIANLICQACKMQIIKNLHDYTMDLNDEMMGFDDFLGRTKNRHPQVRQACRLLRMSTPVNQHD